MFVTPYIKQNVEMYLGLSEVIEYRLQLKSLSTAEKMADILATL